MTGCDVAEPFPDDSEVPEPTTVRTDFLDLDPQQAFAGEACFTVSPSVFDYDVDVLEVQVDGEVAQRLSVSSTSQMEFCIQTADYPNGPHELSVGGIGSNMGLGNLNGGTAQKTVMTTVVFDQSPPTAPELRASVDDGNIYRLSWNRNRDANFRAYDLWRSDGNTDEKIATFTDREAVSYVDTVRYAHVGPLAVQYDLRKTNGVETAKSNVVALPFGHAFRYDTISFLRQGDHIPKPQLRNRDLTWGQSGGLLLVMDKAVESNGRFPSSISRYTINDPSMLFPGPRREDMFRYVEEVGRSEGTLTVWMPRESRVKRTVRVPVSNPQKVDRATSLADGYVYYTKRSTSGDYRIYRIDPGSGDVIQMKGTLPEPFKSQYNVLISSPDGVHLYIIESGENNEAEYLNLGVLKVNGDAISVTETRSFKKKPGGLEFSTDSQRMYLSLYDDASLLVLNTSNLKTMDTLDLSAETSADGDIVTVAATDAFLYVGIRFKYSSRILQIRHSTKEIVWRYDAPVLIYTVLATSSDRRLFLDLDEADMWKVPLIKID